jgi:hypothetical protein
MVNCNGISILVYNYFIWSMIPRDTNLWSLLLYMQSLLHYIENAQETTILSYNKVRNSKRIKKWGKSMCVCACLDAGWWLVSTLND